MWKVSENGEDSISADGEHTYACNQINKVWFELTNWELVKYIML